MNSKKSSDNSIFVQYDDNNIEHLRNAPDYGQPESSSAWSEIDSDEYEDYVLEIENQILKFSLLKITPFSTTHNIK